MTEEEDRCTADVEVPSPVTPTGKTAPRRDPIEFAGLEVPLRDHVIYVDAGTAGAGEGGDR
jgi:hypothetical protein